MLALVLIIDIPVFVSWFLPMFTSREYISNSQTLYFYVSLYISICMSIILVVLTFSTYQLILKLNKIEFTISAVSFRKEKFNVMLTVIVFDITSAIRVILHCTVYPKMYLGTTYTTF